MQMKCFKQILVLMAIYSLGFSSVYAQSIYKISDSKDLEMKLSGTSTLHKWAMNAHTFSGEAQFGFKSENELASLKSLTFALEVENLKSDKKAMDKNAYKALKTDTYKDILYKLKSATVSPEKNGKYLIKTEGNLSIAGVTKEIKMDVFCAVNKDATITCIGSKKLQMTDYQVKPPTFLLGAMKTGDEITLDFTLVYRK
jgi:polyisoprenoid-binding protein YceI